MSNSAWDPGLSSDIPTRLLPLVTLYRPENSTIDYEQAKAASEFCGLEPKLMVSLRLERLILHELLIRVTGSLTVPDGPNYEELGINLRSMAATIYGHVEQHLPELEAHFAGFEAKVDKTIRGALAPVLAPPPPPEPEPGFLARLMGKKPAPPPPDPVPAALTRWRAPATDPMTAACNAALADVVGGVIATRGRLVPDADLITELAARLVRSRLGSQEVGRLIEPYFQSAVDAEGYRRLPPQAKPVVMNVKGASAAGKSTIRPEQRKLAENLGTPWEDFALISPDYWRKQMLEYESLGEDAKYGAMLTGHELEIIDRKLDEYMARQHQSGQTPHLLIDRFRFDSFKAAQESTLLTRFGDRAFFFFMITPPAATVERAWHRGRTTGRYKAVDDLLYHNIEAYEGIPKLFFSWIASRDRQVHFEFLDNSVALGERARTVAYGTRDKMVVLDVECLCDISRFAHVNIEATEPEDALITLPDPPIAFLKDCVTRIPQVIFADHQTRKAYAQTTDGQWTAAPSEHALLDALELPDSTPMSLPKLDPAPHLLGA